MGGRALVALSLLATLLPATAAARPYDLDGDGRQELAFGWPGWNSPDGTLYAGAALVLEGTEAGVTLDEHFIREPVSGGVAFGRAFASGDFDGDGRAELAVASIDALTVVRGSRAVARIPMPPLGDETLVAGDVNRDGYSDVAAATLDTVMIVFGGRAGLRARRARTIEHRARGFPSTLALGDVDRDRHLDLVESYPGAPGVDETDRPPVPEHALFCPGGRRGPRSCRRMGGGGGSLAIADVTGDGYRDVIQGAGSRPVVRIFRGTPRGPARRPIRILPDVRPVPEPVSASGFGASVAAARLDGDRFADIVVGQPGHRPLVTVLRGGPDGLAADGHITLEADPDYEPVHDAGYQGFGAAVSLLDFTGDGRKDLAVGAPGGEAPRECECTDGSISIFRGAGARLFESRPVQTVDLHRLGRPTPVRAPNNFSIGGELGRTGSSR